MVAAMASKIFVAQWMPVSISGEGEADVVEREIGATLAQACDGECGGHGVTPLRWVG